MSKIEVNTIEPQCGTTLTLGASGDTVTLASGASQSGFGRTGTVDWNTTKKTADFTATNGAGFFVDTGSGIITATLPASPSAGNIVAIKDYDGNFGTNKCIVARNGSNIRGATNNFELQKNNSGAVFIYVDATEGWQVFVDGSDKDAQIGHISATGGTETTSGNFKIHTFTGPGTFTVACAGDIATVDYLVIAGGGGGGSNGGGGGAGGYRFSNGTTSGCYTTAPSPLAPLGDNGLPVTAQAYPIVVGSGGVAPSGSPLGGSKGGQGGTSSFSTISSAGGGGGGSQDGGFQIGGNGGSGGGGGQADDPSPCGGYSGGDNKGTGNTPPVSPPQGNNGGRGSTGGTQGAGGGGGAGAVGSNANPTSGSSSTGGAGGTGIASCITASPVTRGGGGGGSGAAGQGAGGAGGGGAAANPGPGTAGTANTGGGGGGARTTCHVGGTGGSGVVIIRYQFQ